MHDTAMTAGQQFLEQYAKSHMHIVEIGSQDINGGLRSHAPQGSTYTGLDHVAGPGVDFVLTDPYQFPLAPACADIVIASSVLEHSELFWLTFLEMVRICRPGGYVYINAPSNGPIHRFPVDCWRFYPDSAQALIKWAKRSRYDLDLVSVRLVPPVADVWIDYCAVFRRR